MFPSTSDRILIWVLRACAALSGGIVLLIVIFLVVQSLPALRNVGFGLFTDPSWHPTEAKFNLTPMIVGTLLAAMGAVLLATPLGVLSALFCEFFAPRAVAGVYGRLLELLAGIPSVIYGYWGLVVLVPIVGRLHPHGPSLLSAVLILTVMILPTIALMARSAIQKVPVEYVQSAAALGLTRWTTIRSVVLPTARAGIFTGILLAAGRAIGETMAVLMVCGNVAEFPTGIFDRMRTLTANIALELGPAVGDHRSTLFASGLLLMGMVALLVVAAEWLTRGHLYD